MVKHQVHLLLLSIAGFFRRMRYDFVAELTVGICCTALGLTFFAIFEDFVNQQLVFLSANLHYFFANTFAAACCLVGGLFVIRWLRQGGELGPYDSMGRFLAVEPDILNGYGTIRRILILGLSLICIHGFAWMFFQLPLFWRIAWFFIHSSWCWYRSKRPVLEGQQRYDRLLKSSENSTRLSALVHWRLSQMLFRDKRIQSLFVLSLMSALGMILAGYLGLVFVAHFPVAWLTGFLLAMAIALQGAEDLRMVWMERNFGVTHQGFIQTHRVIAIILGGCAGIFTVGLWWLFRGMKGEDLIMVIQFSAIILASPLLAPSLLLQIDGRRPGIQVLTLVMLSLFVCTAVFAHILGCLVLPLAIHFGDQLQEGRHYRA